MFTQKDEELFFIKHLNKNQKVLEYGSGESTIEIANKISTLISVEHQKKWYDQLITSVPKNCNLLLKEPNLPYVEGQHCGTYEEFKDYIESPLNFKPFDLILIDGRARVSCASICKDLGHKDTLVFIHDFNRPEYKEALNYLILEEEVGTMAKFKIKF